MKQRLATLSGVLLAGSPAPFALAEAAHGQSLPTWAALSAGLSSVLALGSSASMRARPRSARGAGIVSIGLAAVVAAPALRGTPQLTLLFAIVALACIDAMLPGRDSGGAERAPQPAATRARAAALAALGFWLLTILGPTAPAGRLGLLSVSASLGLATAAALHWMIWEGRYRPGRIALLLTSAALVALAVWRSGRDPQTSLQAAALLPLTALFALPVATRNRGALLEPITGHPERLLVATFAGMCALGTLVLALPIASADARPIPLVDAAFTAVSAVCVTGLVVRDTGADFSPLGQALILLQIQLGGLGIMTFSTAAIQLFGGRMSLRHEGALAQLLSPEDQSQIFSATRRVLVFSLAVELAGALCLWPGFAARGMGAAEAAWKALFTAVSAFCNAGFALDADSLIGFQRDPAVLHIVALLIIVGGLSPAAAIGATRLALRRNRGVSLQVKLSLAMSALLLVVAFLAVLAFEWSATLTELPAADRLHNAWFQSVTLRTAGFNSLDFAAMQPATLLLSMLWMFIGGSPGGTAGGIKTTTVAVLFLSVLATIRGRASVQVFGREIPTKSVFKAAAIVTVASFGVFLACLSLLLTQPIAPDIALFEVVSALGTVGLSIGGTAKLDGIGKATIIACMFVGRVGTLTLFMFLGQRMLASTWRMPEEEVAVG